MVQVPVVRSFFGRALSGLDMCSDYRVLLGGFPWAYLFVYVLVEAHDGDVLGLALVIDLP